MNKYYYIQVFGREGARYSYCDYYGKNAMEAFEQAVLQGYLNIPSGQEVEVIASCRETSLNIKFRAEVC